MRASIPVAALALVVSFHPASAQAQRIEIYVDRLEVAGMHFETMKQLREYLLTAPTDVSAIGVSDCVTPERIGEVQRVVIEVLSERIAARGGQRSFVAIDFASVPCP